MSHIPKEFEFKLVYSNCEYWLEMKLLGWSHRSLNQIHSPWELSNLVDRYLNTLKYDDFTCEKPASGTAEITTAMKRIGPYYGALYITVVNMWFLKYNIRKEG